MKKNLLDKVKRFPLRPGVYQFIGKKGESHKKGANLLQDTILYIGRATSLRRRVLNYFTDRIDARIAEMVSLAADIKYIETDTVLEAIILEANLIKKYWPKYNVKDKDDRSFIYIVIAKRKLDSSLRRNDKGGSIDFPKPLIIRGKELQKFSVNNFYVFGPYQSLTLVKNALKIIRPIFPYGTCKPLSGKPCFDYQLGLCPGACIGAISKKDYWKNINNIILLLNGEKKKLLKKLQKENPNKVLALKHIQDVALITNENLESRIENLEKKQRIEGYDISHLTGKETYGSMVVFLNGEPDKNEYRIFKIKEAPAGDDLRALQEVITRRFLHSEWPTPSMIMIDGGKPQINAVAKVFEKMNISIPLVGISKYKGDELVFLSGTKKSLKDLAQSMKPILLRVREEAHRFAQKSSRRKRNNNLIGKNFKRNKQ